MLTNVRCLVYIHTYFAFATSSGHKKVVSKTSISFTTGRIYLPAFVLISAERAMPSLPLRKLSMRPMGKCPRVSISRLPIKDQQIWDLFLLEWTIYCDDSGWAHIQLTSFSKLCQRINEFARISCGGRSPFLPKAKAQCLTCFLEESD